MEWTWAKTAAVALVLGVLVYFALVNQAAGMVLVGWAKDVLHSIPGGG